jgi:hypothetical protein
MNRIVVGNVNGQIKSLAAKLSTLHTKNNFSFAIVTGDLFDADDDDVTDLIAEDILIPLPTYFTVGVNTLPQRVVDKLANDEDVSHLYHHTRAVKSTRLPSGLREELYVPGILC